MNHSQTNKQTKIIFLTVFLDKIYLFFVLNYYKGPRGNLVAQFQSLSRFGILVVNGLHFETNFLNISVNIQLN